jgi:hypothetical protein
MLSLPSPSHHLHSTCTNHLFSFVVQFDFILNSCLWVHPNPILELQHAFLPLKCYKLNNVLWFFSFSIVSLWDPHLGSLKSLGACQLVKRILRSFGLLDKVITYIMDKGSNFGFLTIALTLVVSCPLKLVSPFVGFCFKHVMSKPTQYVAHDSKVCQGIMEMILKS